MATKQKKGAKKSKRVTKSKQAAKTKRATKPRALVPPPSVSVGDAVRMPTEASNAFVHYDPRQEISRRGTDAIEGLVCSIREVATGKLVTKTKGSPSGYVLEVLHDRTFHPHFSGNINAGGPRGTTEIRENPKWVHIRALLRDMATSKKFVSQASGGLSGEPFVALLDGWQVVKLHADMVELVP